MGNVAAMLEQMVDSELAPRGKSQTAYVIYEPTVGAEVRRAGSVSRN